MKQSKVIIGTLSLKFDLEEGRVQSTVLSTSTP